MKICKFFSSIGESVFSVSYVEQGGILCHWVWDGIDTTEKISSFLLKKKFTEMNKRDDRETDLKEKRTRVELYVSNPWITCFRVQHIKGDGTMSEQGFYKEHRFKEKLTWIVILSIVGSIASLLSLIW